MWSSGSRTASVEVEDLAIVHAREYDAMAKRIAALRIDKADLKQVVEGITEGSEMPVQTSAGSIADSQSFDDT
jgi:formylmethanofuran dehydrogenase subunit D